MFAEVRLEQLIAQQGEYCLEGPRVRAGWTLQCGALLLFAFLGAMNTEGLRPINYGQSANLEFASLWKINPSGPNFWGFLSSL